MSTPDAAADERRFLAWLCHQADDPDDLGHLARGHLEGILDLSWSARGETPAIRASYGMARAKFDRERAAGLVRNDGTRKLPPRSQASGRRRR